MKGARLEVSELNVNNFQSFPTAFMLNKWFQTNNLYIFYTDDKCPEVWF